jgi:hypothetical protein
LAATPVGLFSRVILQCGFSYPCPELLTRNTLASLPSVCEKLNPEKKVPLLFQALFVMNIEEKVKNDAGT